MLQELLLAVLQAVIAFAVPVLTCYAVQFFKVHTVAAKNTIQNDLARRALAELNDVVPKAVLCIAQTYVDTLKKEGQFSTANQREALRMATARAQSMLTAGAANYLRRTHEDLAAYMETQIEAAVKRLR